MLHLKFLFLAKGLIYNLATVKTAIYILNSLQYFWRNGTSISDAFHRILQALLLPQVTHFTNGIMLLKINKDKATAPLLI